MSYRLWITMHTVMFFLSLAGMLTSSFFYVLPALLAGCGVVMNAMWLYKK